MSDERRYSDEEVREILTRATDVSDPTSSRVSGPHESTGLTLTELKDVGREVGIEPTDIERAAASLERAGQRLPRKHLLGMSVGVGRVVELPRGLTDREWEMLVSELRATFEAKGKVESHGDLRSWTNSRLHAHVEPTPEGYRLRLGTVKGNAYVYEALGVGGVLIGLISLLSSGAAGGLGEPIMLAGMGMAALIANRIRLPIWAGRREEQMEHITRRALELIAGTDEASEA
jgi:hypothetical protein